MDWGNAAQWAAIVVSLAIGLRADRRAKRGDDRDQRLDLANCVAALQKLIGYLEEAMRTLPEDHREVARWSSTSLQTLRTSGQQVSAAVTTAFPDSAGEFITIDECLRDLCRVKQMQDSFSGAEALAVLRALYQALRLLCIAAARRLPMQGRELTSRTLEADHYRAAFESRYQRVREHQWESIWQK